MKPQSIQYDVVVVGGGPSGIPAAIAAARNGAKTLLIERNGFLGGAATSGLGLLSYLDASGREIIGGIGREIIERLRTARGTLGHYRCPVHNSITALNPEVFKLVALDMALEAGVEPLFYCEPIRAVVEDGRLCAIEVYGKGTRLNIRAHCFIDATGDGDVAAMAGAEFDYGQDASRLTQPCTAMFTVSNVDLTTLFQYIRDNPGEIILPDTYAAEYSPEFFENTPGHCFIGFPRLLKKAAENGDYHIPRDRFIYIVSAEKGRVAINSTRLLDVDATDPESLSAGIVEGSMQVLELLDVMRKYLPGFAQCRLSAVAPIFGVRESRHFHCKHRLTGEAVAAGLIPEDTVALGGYNIDVHAGRGVGIELKPLHRPYGIPLDVMRPVGVEGLLITGRAIDADPQAFGSSRVMGTCICLGEAAGTLAALAAAQNASPAALSFSLVRGALLEHGAILQ